MTVESFWVVVNEPTLRQGDYLPACLVPVFVPTLDGASGEGPHRTLPRLRLT